MAPGFVEGRHRWTAGNGLKNFLIVLSMMLFLALAVFATVNTLRIFYDLAVLETDRSLVLSYPQP
jgi:hypothetical protein